MQMMIGASIRRPRTADDFHWRLCGKEWRLMMGPRWVGSRCERSGRRSRSCWIADFQPETTGCITHSTCDHAKAYLVWFIIAHSELL